MNICPSCEGRKGGEVFACGPNHHFEPMYMPCYFCKGEGQVTDLQVRQFERGKELRKARMAKNCGQITAARMAKMKVGEWSDLEHGRASLAEIDAAINWIETIGEEA